MKIIRHVILFILCLPFNLIVGWPAVLIARACWGTPLTLEIAPTSGGLPALTTDLKSDSWAGRTWGRAWAGVTLGHAIVYGPGARTAGAPWAPVQAHEHDHVEQFEGTMTSHALFGALLSVLSVVSEFAWLTGLITWFFGYLVFLTGGWLGAILRGESAYSGSAHEEAAVAETKREFPDA